MCFIYVLCFFSLGGGGGGGGGRAVGRLERLTAFVPSALSRVWVYRATDWADD